MLIKKITLNILQCDSDKVHILSFSEIKQAAERIEDGIIHTPLCVSTNWQFLDS